MDDLRPTLLLVGAGEPLEEAVRRYLKRHRVAAESADTADLVAAVTASAPDLVLLWGDAVKDGGQRALETLAASPSTSLAPVALLLDDASLGDRLRAFRSGAVSVIARSASADAIAKRLSELIAELPERPGEATGELGEATLDELVQLVSRRLRSGIVSVETDGEEAPVRLVLGTGVGVAAALDAFVAQLAPLVAEAKPLRYELFETAGGRLQLDDGPPAETADLEVFDGLRVLIMEDDPARADGFAQALRQRGALVAVTDFGARGLERARMLDPAVVVLDAGVIEGSGFETVRRIRRDTRLRWASMLVARWDELWPSEDAAPDLERVASRIAPMVAPDRALEERTSGDAPFDTRMELTGPSRFLRALARVAGTRRMSARTAGTAVDVDLADGLIVGAQGSQGEEPLEGVGALSALLGLAAARVHVERRLHPTAANIMLPVDEALDAALAHTPRDVVSAPPPPLVFDDRSAQPTPAGGLPRPSTFAASGVAKTEVMPPMDQEERPTVEAHVIDPRTLRPTVETEVLDPSDLSWGGLSEVPPPDDEGSAPTMAPPPGYQSEASTMAPPADYAESVAAAEPSLPPRRSPMRTMLGIQPQTPPSANPPMSDLDLEELPPSIPAPPPRALATRRPDASRALKAKTMFGVGAPPPPGERTPPPPPAPSKAHVEAVDVALDEMFPDDERTEAGDSMARAAEVLLGEDAEVSAEGVDDTRSEPPRELDAQTYFSREVDTERPEPVSTPPSRGRWVVAGLLVAALAAGGLLGIRQFHPEWLPARLASLVGLTTEGPVAPPPTVASVAPVAPVAPPETVETDVEDPVAEDPLDEEPVAEGPEDPLVEEPDVEETDVEEPVVEESAVEDEPTPDDPQVETPEELAGMSQRERDRRADALARDGSRAVADGELPAARALFDRALTLDEGNPHAIAGRAELHLAQGQGAQALEWAERAVGRRGRRAAYRVLLGDALKATGDVAGAQREWRQALELEPDNREARARLR